MADEHGDGTPGLGAFLRARRGLVDPERAGVPVTGRRQVSGLRREELAMLAGVSVDYYVRLEQGRDRHPSAEVLDALAGALELDEEATDYLHELARPRPRRRRAVRPERVDPHLAGLLEDWSTTPAYVLGRCWDVLASNAVARALHPSYAVGHNLLRTVFLDPAAPQFYLDWDRFTRNAVAALRASGGATAPSAPGLAELVGELSLGSERFRRLWARHDVRHKAHVTKRVHHPQVGDLELHVTMLDVGGAPGQQLAVYHAPSGTPSAERLALLAGLAMH